MDKSNLKKAAIILYIASFFMYLSVIIGKFTDGSFNTMNFLLASSFMLLDTSNFIRYGKDE